MQLFRYAVQNPLARAVHPTPAGVIPKHAGAAQIAENRVEDHHQSGTRGKGVPESSAVNAALDFAGVIHCRTDGAPVRNSAM